MQARQPAADRGVAASNDELNRQPEAPQGPVLGPADLAQPLPLLKAQVRAVLRQAEQQIVRERQQTVPISPWHLLPDLLRNTRAFPALAIGFAALARRRGKPISLLQEWQFRRWRRVQQGRRRHEAVGIGEDHLRQLIGPDDQEQGRGCSVPAWARCGGCG